MAGGRPRRAGGAVRLRIPCTTLHGRQCVTPGAPVRQLEVNEISPATEPVRFEVRRRGTVAFVDRVAGAFDEHQARIHGLMLATTRDPELAADLTQEAFLLLLKEARAGRYPDNPGAWLYRTASNLAISRARRAAVARRLAPRLLRRDEPATPEGIALDREQSRAMRDVLALLPVAERAALIMAAQGLTGEEIAAHLGRTHPATRTLLFRGRQRLRRLMAEREFRR